MSLGIGVPGDPAAASDTGAATLIGLMKRMLGKLSTLGPQAASNALPVTDTSDTLYVGTLATSITAAPIAASQAVREVAVQNDPDNTADMLIGNSTAQTIQLKPGDTLIIPVANLATIYAKSVSGTPTLNYLGRS